MFDVKKTDLEKTNRTYEALYSLTVGQKEVLVDSIRQSVKSMVAETDLADHACTVLNSKTDIIADTAIMFWWLGFVPFSANGFKKLVCDKHGYNDEVADYLCNIIHLADENDPNFDEKVGTIRFYPQSFFIQHMQKVFVRNGGDETIYSKSILERLILVFEELGLVNRTPQQFCKQIGTPSGLTIWATKTLRTKMEALILEASETKPKPKFPRIAAILAPLLVTMSLLIIAPNAEAFGASYDTGLFVSTLEDTTASSKLLELSGVDEVKELNDPLRPILRMSKLTTETSKLLELSGVDEVKELNDPLRPKFLIRYSQ